MNDMITITRDEYARLTKAAEMLDDIRAYDEAMANRDEGMPHDLVKRLIDGESPIAVFRAWRDLSQAELARRSGVNRVQIVEIEGGRKRGSVDTLKAIANALDVSVDELI